MTRKMISRHKQAHVATTMITEETGSEVKHKANVSVALVILPVPVRGPTCEPGAHFYAIGCDAPPHDAIVKAIPNPNPAPRQHEQRGR